jgi:hypothetical protein
MAHPRPVQPPSPHQQQQAALAAKLVMLSHIFGWGGIGLLLVLGPVLAISVNGTLGVIGMGIGLLSAVVGAIPVKSGEDFRVASSECE